MTPQTVSLEVAKKLKEVGWRKETTFYYGNKLTIIDEMKVGKMMYETSYSLSPHMELLYSQDRFQIYRKKFPAPQLHEILEELPAEIIIDGVSYFLVLEKNNYCGRLSTFVDYTASYDSKGDQTNINPHDAAALLWIWLVQNGYITLPTNT